MPSRRNESADQMRPQRARQHNNIQYSKVLIKAHKKQSNRTLENTKLRRGRVLQTAEVASSPVCNCFGTLGTRADEARRTGEGTTERQRSADEETSRA